MDKLDRKVFLIRQKTSNCYNLNTSYALALLNTILGPLVSVKVLDNNGKYRTYSDKDILAMIENYKPDIIGFNINMFNAFNTYQLIRVVKSYYPDIPLITGGVHANHCYCEILETPAIVVRGEGDLTFPALIKKMDETYFRNNKRFDKDVYTEISKIKGILFRNSKGEIIDTGPADIIRNLDELPFITFRNYNLNDFVRKPQDNIGSTNVIITQRGCPYSCIYCKSNDFGGRIREASPGYIVRYIEYLHSNYSYKHIYFLDNNFTVNRKRTMEFCKEFIHSGLNKVVSLECQTNILCPFDEELLSLMIEANFLRVQFGIDRLTEFGIKKARIRPSNNSLMPKLKLLKSKEMKTFCSILLGMDFDNRDSMRAELEELGKIKNYVQIISIGAVIPVPGTELYLRHPEANRWYLKRNFTQGGIHYYDTALTGNSKVIELNLFNLSRTLIYQIIKIQLVGLKINVANLLGRKGLFLFYIDRILILLSYHLSTLFPKLELIIFKYIKAFRFSLMLIVYDLVYYRGKGNAKG